MSSKKMMFIQPKDCIYCGNGYYALNHAINHSRSQGWTSVVVSRESADKNTVYNAIDQHDPCAIFGFGHGSNCGYTGNSIAETIFDCTDCSKVKDRVVYLLSCLTANGLGPEMMNQGALAYAGFNISWTWLSTNTNNDPYSDKYAKGFYESAVELWKALSEGKTFKEAVQRSVDKYNWWIDYWFDTNPEDENAQECIKWLAHDRDGLIAIDKCEGKNQLACDKYGGYYYNKTCHVMPEGGGDGINAGVIILIPIFCLMGIVLLVGQTRPKNKYRYK